MATLPDLDTSTISMLAYWNCTDHGFDAPTDLTPLIEWGAVREYTTYDNGVEGRAVLSQATGGNETYHFRYKTDGWFLVWFTRDTAYGAGQRGEGPHLLVPDWGASMLPETTLALTIGKMWGLFPAGSPADVAPADVAHSWLPDPDATTITLGTLYVDVGTVTGEFSYGADTTLSEVVAFGSQGIMITQHVYFDGNDVCPHQEGGAVGSRDVLADGLAPNPDTVYPFEAYVESDYNQGSGSYAQGGVLALWS